MCHIFAGQDPQNYAFETRSVRLLGYSTSIRLEAKFWVVIEEISASQGMTMAKFLSQLYEEANEIHGTVSNFASLLRCCCLNYLTLDFDKERLISESQSVSQSTISSAVA
ncbi:MAG: putative DNA-binding ribbon-helix-helix protein [Gammaproteobacteria bacterium]|jgi:predicted DNA-binding ribbon-helix-helix protein